MNQWSKEIPNELPNVKHREKFKLHVDMEKIREEIKKLETSISNKNYKVVFCHNDLLGPNVIFNHETNQMFFVDYEYASYNYRGFDIANHFCEYAGFELDYTKYPNYEIRKQFVTSYLKTLKENDKNNTEPTKEEIKSLLEEVESFVPLSHMLWGLWGIIQSIISDIDFDYLSYGITRFKHYFITSHQALGDKE